MKLELCAASVEAIQVAREFGFSRIELCQNLEQGGLTPSPGFIEYALAHGLETHVLIRPRSGGFRYSEAEIEIMLRDIVECKAMGVHGVVVGVLDEMGLIHEQAVELMVQKAGSMDVTFHRAFDDTYDFEKSMDALIKTGVKRILSSGLARNVEQGLSILQQMKQYAENRIEIMPGGGVNVHNAPKLIQEVNPDALHFSGTVKVTLDEDSKFNDEVLQVDRQKVLRLLEAITIS